MHKILNSLTGTAALPDRKLGKNGPKVTAMGYGCMGLSAFYGPPKSDEDRLYLLDKLYEKGELFWDSADMYADNEDLLGKLTMHSADTSKAFNQFILVVAGIRLTQARQMVQK